MDTRSEPAGLKPGQAFIKRAFDILVSVFGLTLTWWLILLACLVSAIDTRTSGLFLQERVGLRGRRFKIIKICTMRRMDQVSTVVTTSNDPRITRLGRFFRSTKMDELPQLLNVLVGNMSLVGPRPDMPEYMDSLKGDDRIVLAVRPGITGPASLEFRNEEQLLAQQDDPERYNREVIFPRKVEINRDYVRQYHFSRDLFYIYRTIFG